MVNSSPFMLTVGVVVPKFLPVITIWFGTTLVMITVLSIFGGGATCGSAAVCPGSTGAKASSTDIAMVRSLRQWGA
jgi:hypothetical protein